MLRFDFIIEQKGLTRIQLPQQLLVQPSWAFLRFNEIIMDKLAKMQFDPEIARKYGVEEAIMYSNISFWVAKNKANRQNEKNGKYWTYNSNRAFAELFPWWTEEQVRRIIRNLIKNDLIEKDNFNKKNYDKTSWYTIGSNTIIHLGVSTNGSVETNEPIPDSKPDDKQHIILDSSKPEDLPSQENIIDPLVRLPDRLGKTSLVRLGSVYRSLWYKNYGTACTGFKYGMFGKIINGLLEDHTEMQIAVLLFTFFEWRGGSNSNENERIYLSDKGFPLNLMISKIDIMIAYLTNNRGLVYTDPQEVRRYAVRVFKNIL